MRKLNILVIATALVGAALAAYRGNEVRQLRRQRDELASRYGHLEIDDGSKPCFVRMPTDDPMHFRWRMYVPGNYRARLRDQNGSERGFSYSDPREMIADVKFRIIDGRLQLFHKFGGGSGLQTIGSSGFAEFVQERWDELDIEVGGSHRPAVVDQYEKELLIQIRVPEALREAARDRLTERQIERFADSIITLHFGSPAAFEKR